MSEIRQSLRALSQSRWYAGTIIAVMALCVSLSTTVFAVVDGVLFKPLPYQRPAELYMMTGGYLTGQHGGISIAPRNARDWTAAVPGAVSTLLSTGLTSHPLGDVRGWAPIVGSIDAHFFEVLGTQPLVGGLTDADFAFGGASPVSVLISYGVWQSQFGGRPDVVGQPMPPAASLVADRTYRVAGVLRRDFIYPWFGELPEVLMPLTFDPARNEDLRFRQFTAIVRLPSTEPLSSVQSRMDAAAAAEKTDWVPRPREGSPVFDHANLDRLDERLTRFQRPTFGLVFAAAAVLMLLGCLNVSGLMASRTLNRRQDIGVRRALGGSAADIARLLVIENATVVGIGAAIGVALSAPLTRLTLRLLSSSMGLLKTPGIDVRVMTFAVLLAALAVVVASVWPVWRAVRLPAVPDMNAGTRSSGRGSAISRFIVVTAQVAIGLALTLGGVLLVGSLIQVWRTNPGFASDHVIVLQGRSLGTTRAARDAAMERFEQDVRHVPGITSVSATRSGFGSGMLMNAFKDGATVAVQPGFFTTMGMTLVDGRFPTDDEIANGATVAVMSRRAAARVFKDQKAVGRQIAGFVKQQPQPFDVIGVAEDVTMTTWDSESVGQIFASFALVSDEQPSVSIVARADHADQALAALLPLARRRDAVDVRVTSVAIGADVLNDTVRSRRLNSWLFGGFAMAALAIVGVGILGLMAMNSATRTREVGIRIAMGSTPMGVVQLLVREQLMAVVAGLVAGGLISAWALKFVQTYLFHINGTDPRMWAAAAAVMLLVALIGAAIPSVRVSRIDAAKALRA